MNCKECGRKRSLPNLRYPVIWLEGLRKTTDNLRIVDVLAEIRSGYLRKMFQWTAVGYTAMNFLVP
jgi:hypothetical protein